MIPVGSIIKSLREIRELGQQELADGAGVSKSTIQKYEKGEVEPEGTNYRNVMEALGATVELVRQARKKFEQADQAAEWIAEEAGRESQPASISTKAVGMGDRLLEAMTWLSGLSAAQQRTAMAALQSVMKPEPPTAFNGGRKNRERKSPEEPK